MNKGILVVFDGIDGAGKTTQAKLLLEVLKNANIDAVLSKEPTNGQWGKIIRSSAINGRLPLDQELDLFIKDREEHVKSLIWPSLEAGKVVILDRYYYSSIAYQGARGADVDLIKEKMQEIAIVPDITFIIDLDIPTALHRIETKRGDTPDQFEKADYLEVVQANFINLCETEKEIHKLNGHNSIGHLHSHVLKDFKNGPLKNKYCAKDYPNADCGFCSYQMSKTCDWFELAKKIIPGIGEEM